MFQMSLAAKKVFEERLNLHIIVGLLFFSLSLWISEKNRATLKKLFNLNSRLSWGVQYPRYTEYSFYYSYQQLQ